MDHKLKAQKSAQITADSPQEAYETSYPVTMDTLHALWFWPLAAPQVFLVQMGKGTVSVALLLVPAYLWQVITVGVLPLPAFAISLPILLAFSLPSPWTLVYCIICFT